MDDSQKPSHRSGSFQSLPGLIRWIHIYLSMAGFAGLIFFSATGITLNHPELFESSEPKTREYAGSIPEIWIHGENTSKSSNFDYDIPAGHVDRLAIVEHFRAEHGIRGAVTSFEIDSYEIAVTFSGPSYSADAYINIEDGAYTVQETSFGLVALLNDLHKGRSAGSIWSWVIDILATISILVSLSGLYMLLKLRFRKRTGLITCIAGFLALLFVFLVWVP